MSAALFPGSFDPVTNGHVWVVARSLALDLFDKIVVGVVNDPPGATLFSAEERVKLWQESARAVNVQRIEVVAIDDEYPVRCARRLGCQFILRGIRSALEYEAEVVLQKSNHDLEPLIQTVFLVPNVEYADTSSSTVRGLIGTPVWKEAVKRHVPVATWEALMGKFGKSGAGK